MKRIYQSPESFSSVETNAHCVFLAGSIEMDTAVNWQKKCEAELNKKYIVLNPRRNSWNSNWEQSIHNSNFKEQVDWELDALERAQTIILYFANDTKSPISLLEFGLYANSGKLKVVVEDRFWRKGNVDIVCERYKIQQFNTLTELLNKLNSNIA